MIIGLVVIEVEHKFHFGYYLDTVWTRKKGILIHVVFYIDCS